MAEKHNIGKPELPAYRKGPSQFEDGSRSHEFPSARAYFHQIFFEACDLLSVELKKIALKTSIFHPFWQWNSVY